MIKRKYHAKEMDFDNMMSVFRVSKIEVEHLMSKHHYPDPADDVIGEYVYLLNSIAMEVKTVAGQSAMSVNDDVYLTLIGKEEHMGEIEKIVQMHFKKD